MKTKEKVLNEIRSDWAYEGDDSHPISDRAIHDAMERYSEERLKEWKEKLKQMIREEYKDEFLYATEGILKLIDSASDKSAKIVEETQDELFRKVIEIFNSEHKRHGRPDYTALTELFTITKNP
jgi:hypothetical protein